MIKPSDPKPYRYGADAVAGLVLLYCGGGVSTELEEKGERLMEHLLPACPEHDKLTRSQNAYIAVSALTKRAEATEQLELAALIDTFKNIMRSYGYDEESRLNDAALAAIEKRHKAEVNGVTGGITFPPKPQETTDTLLRQIITSSANTERLEEVIRSKIAEKKDFHDTAPRISRDEYLELVRNHDMMPEQEKSKTDAAVDPIVLVLEQMNFIGIHPSWVKPLDPSGRGNPTHVEVMLKAQDAPLLDSILQNERISPVKRSRPGTEEIVYRFKLPPRWLDPEQGQKLARVMAENPLIGWGRA